MDAQRPSSGSKSRLKELRLRVGLTTREVEAKSHEIAEEHHNREYYISHAWVTDLENGEFKPTLCKVYTLSALYHTGFSEIASCFGVRIADLRRDRASIGVPKTHLVDDEADLEMSTASVPVQFKPEFRLEKTDLLARVVEKWDEIPVGFLQYLDLRNSAYGYIGLEDYTLFPLVRPGSLVQIDSSQRTISAERWKTEFDRPIYFVELRSAYVCSWCEVDRGQLIVIPHPHSHLDVRRFGYPSQAEIVGRVTGVAMRIAGEKIPERREPFTDKAL